MNTSASIKLTSKNQLTMPAKIVRQLKLKAGDRLNYQLKDGAVILKPRPSVNQQIETMWADSARLNASVASDESIKQSVRDYYRNQKRP